MPTLFVQVDAFTSEPFKGNPAAICILPSAASETWMQNIALEMNLSETAFLHKQDDGFNLRWFTPKCEVDLCGHATLASAHVLWETGELAPDTQARFYTRSGKLTAEKRGDWIELDFPADPDTSCDAPENLLEALGVSPKYVGTGRYDYLLELESEDIIRKMSPNFALLATVPTRGVIVTARSRHSDYDFVSRFFGPSSGLDEDPVTGSAHCCLAPFWATRLGKTELVGYQASERGGMVRVRLDGERVRLYGQAVTVLRGELLQDPFV